MQTEARKKAQKPSPDPLGSPHEQAGDRNIPSPDRTPFANFIQSKMLFCDSEKGHGFVTILFIHVIKAFLDNEKNILFHILRLHLIVQKLRCNIVHSPAIVERKTFQFFFF
ncbi:MAG: hypothetical protein PUK05_05570 [Peptoniphilaceae bacterium]|nr:hypothetical protein [Peptoniphilaceae bacterium]